MKSINLLFMSILCLIPLQSTLGIDFEDSLSHVSSDSVPFTHGVLKLDKYTSTSYESIFIRNNSNQNVLVMDLDNDLDLSVRSRQTYQMDCGIEQKIRFIKISITEIDELSVGMQCGETLYFRNGD